MQGRKLATRTFSLADQQAFATISGDSNPIHMDAVVARRTRAGQPVVHGMHALLWALEVACEALPDMRIEAVKVSFDRFVPLDAPVTLWLAEAPPRRIALCVATSCVATITVNPTRKGSPPTDPARFTGAARDIPLSPAAPRAADATGMAGAVRMRTVAAHYPCLSARTSAGAVDALAAISALVGMVVPGLHSILSAIDLRLGPGDMPGDVLGYEVSSVHDIFDLADIVVASAHLEGKVKAFFRPPPTRQPSMADLSRLVGPDEFAGVKALVIGGSRGIGEVTAKLLAAGGAEVVVSYASGRADADAVARDIVTQGGRCRTFHLDTRDAVAPQLIASLELVPSHIFYFATTRIAQQRDGLFDPDVFLSFTRLYLTAFEELCVYAAGLGRPVTLLYPSSAYVDDRPKGMTEYAMAKAAGEILCIDAARRYTRIRVVARRLPRMLTDQTAQAGMDAMTPAAPHMLAILRELAAMPPAA